jgi:hypothetical protein
MMRRVLISTTPVLLMSLFANGESQAGRNVNSLTQTPSQRLEELSQATVVYDFGRGYELVTHRFSSCQQSEHSDGERPYRGGKRGGAAYREDNKEEGTAMHPVSNEEGGTAYHYGGMHSVRHHHARASYGKMASHHPSRFPNLQGNVANQLNQAELARLQQGAPPMAPQMAPPPPQMQGGNSMGMPGPNMGGPGLSPYSSSTPMGTTGGGAPYRP